MQTAISPLVHLCLIIVKVHEVIFAIPPKSGVHLVAFKLSETLLVGFHGGLVGLELLSEALLSRVLENVEDGVDRAVD